MLTSVFEFRPTGPNTFAIGKVTFDQRARTVTIPARVNPNQSAIEYALVTEQGKTHESLLVTDVQPRQVHLACLLLGLGPAQLSSGKNEPQAVSATNAVEMEVTWDLDGSLTRHSLAQLVALRKPGTEEVAGTLTEGPWIYNGSEFDSEGFRAETDGSIISLIRDPAALVNNPRATRDDDELHMPNKKILPQDGTPVNVTLRLARAEDSGRQAQSWPAPTPRPGYAVVVSARSRADADWRRVVDALREKHSASVVEFQTNVTEVLPELRGRFPRYVCFVAQPQEATRAFVAQVHRLTRKLDDDPYTDCFWGILTGYDATNALRIAQHREPLTVRKVASGTEVALEMCEEGVWHCELNKGKMVRKEKGGDARELQGPDDSTEALVKTLDGYKADLFITSGHATERDWMIGFRYRNGFFKHENGQLYGLDTQGRKFSIASPNPKVYLPIGNCLMGHIDRPDCMALAWMNNAGVHQMLGYTEPTWYGYMGWGVLDYFVEQPGRYTLTEAFFANHHALVHRLATWFPELVSAESDARGRPSISPRLSDQAKAAGLTLQDARGLLFDRDVVAFYGDPAWEARMADISRAWEQSLSWKADTYVFEIQPRRGEKSFAPINTNGSQRGGRPFIAYLPQRVRDVKVIEGAELNPVITDDFLLVPNPRQCDPAKKYRVVFTAAALPAKP